MTRVEFSAKLARFHRMIPIRDKNEPIDQRSAGFQPASDHTGSLRYRLNLNANWNETCKDYKLDRLR